MILRRHDRYYLRQYVATLAASLPDLLLPDLADHAPFLALLDSEE